MALCQMTSGWQFPLHVSEEQSAQVLEGILARLKLDGYHQDGSWQTVLQRKALVLSFVRE